MSPAFSGNLFNLQNISLIYNINIVKLKKLINNYGYIRIGVYCTVVP